MDTAVHIDKENASTPGVVRREPSISFVKKERRAPLSSLGAVQKSPSLAAVISAMDEAIRERKALRSAHKQSMSVPTQGTQYRDAGGAAAQLEFGDGPKAPSAGALGAPPTPSSPSVFGPSRPQLRHDLGPTSPSFALGLPPHASLHPTPDAPTSYQGPSPSFGPLAQPRALPGAGTEPAANAAARPRPTLSLCCFGAAAATPAARRGAAPEDPELSEVSFGGQLSVQARAAEVAGKVRLPGNRPASRYYYVPTALLRMQTEAAIIERELEGKELRRLPWLDLFLRLFLVACLWAAIVGQGPVVATKVLIRGGIIPASEAWRAWAGRRPEGASTGGGPPASLPLSACAADLNASLFGDACPTVFDLSHVVGFEGEGEGGVDAVPEGGDWWDMDMAESDWDEEDEEEGTGSEYSDDDVSDASEGSESDLVAPPATKLQLDRQPGPPAGAAESEAGLGAAGLWASELLPTSAPGDESVWASLDAGDEEEDGVWSDGAWLWAGSEAEAEGEGAAAQAALGSEPDIASPLVSGGLEEEVEDGQDVPDLQLSDVEESEWGAYLREVASGGSGREEESEGEGAETVRSSAARLRGWWERAVGQAAMMGGLVLQAASLGVVGAVGWAMVRN